MCLLPSARYQVEEHGLGGEAAWSTDDGLRIPCATPRGPRPPGSLRQNFPPEVVTAAPPAAGGHLFPTLCLTMIAALVLGTGLPTSATYIVTSIMAGPALVQLGVPKLGSRAARAAG